MVADLLLEHRSTVRDQVVAWILGATPDRGAGPLRGGGGSLRGGHRQAGDLELGAGRGPGEVLDRVTVLVAGREVHGSEGRAGPQGDVDEADALEEVGPVEGRHHSHAGDHVADRHVHRGLVLVLGLDELVRRLSAGGDLLVEPPQRGSRLRILITQALHQLDREGGGPGSGVEPLERERSTGAATQAEEIVREGVGGLAGRASGDDALGQPTQVLHEHDAEGDRDGPQLADGQGLGPLKSADEALEGLGLEAAVGVRDEGPGQSEHAGIPLQRALRELGQLAVDPRRQVLPDLPHHRVHHVEVVDEPLRGRSRRPFVADHRRDLSIALEQNTSAVSDSGREAAAGLSPGQDPIERDRFRVLLESFGAEEVGPDGLLGPRREWGRGSGEPGIAQWHRGLYRDIS